MADAPAPPIAGRHGSRRLKSLDVSRAEVGRIIRDAVATLPIAIVTWPIATWGPSLGIDQSWIVGLHLAERQGLSFGSDILFTFGPLGFLGYPQPYVAWTSAAALLFVGVLHFLACFVLYRLARQAIGGPAAWVLVLATAFTFQWIAGWPMFGALIFIASGAAVARRAERPSGLLLAGAMGVVIGFGLLGKLNIGFISIVVAGIGVAASAREPRRSLATFCAAVVIAALALWVLTGQRLADLAEYVRGAIEVSLGYGLSMGQLDPQSSWAAGVDALATVVLGGLIWLRASELRPRDRHALAILCLLMVFAAFKGGFTRQGVGMTIYLATLFVAWPLFASERVSRATVAIAVAAMLAPILALNSLPIGTLMDPGTRVQALRDQTSTVLFHRADASLANAKTLREQAGLPPEAMGLLAGQTVDIHPWQTAIAHAYPAIRWRPEPVFQDYSAYTPYLDQQNADFLAGPTAPDRILWMTDPAVGLSIDGRSMWFDSPMAKIRMVCRYLPLASATNWQILGRVTDRCGIPFKVGSVAATAGQPVAIPRGLPPGILTVRISGMGKDLATQIITLVYRSPAWWLKDGSSSYRVPLGINGEPAILATTVDIGYEGGLAPPPPPTTVTIGPDPGAPGDGSPLTVEFEVIPVKPGA